MDIATKIGKAAFETGPRKPADMGSRFPQQEGSLQPRGTVATNIAEASLIFAPAGMSRTATSVAATVLRWTLSALQSVWGGDAEAAGFPIWPRHLRHGARTRDPSRSPACYRVRPQT